MSGLCVSACIEIGCAFRKAGFDVYFSFPLIYKAILGFDVINETRIWYDLWWIIKYHRAYDVKRKQYFSRIIANRQWFVCIFYFTFLFLTVLKAFWSRKRWESECVLWFVTDSRCINKWAEAYYWNQSKSARIKLK